MRASCSSDVVDDFDDFNEKIYYPSSTNSISLINDIQNNDFPFGDEYSNEILKKDDKSTINNSNKTIEYDPQLANLISNELGLNDPQTSRKNAWGNLSYAELIAKAILNSHQQRLTLSQIYSWIILYVPYFRDKADKKSSTGWKNSIRHNLSLHNRFVRIPNEVAGKSSWWTIDLRAKQNRGRRKNQSNENSTKNPKTSHLSTNQKSFTSVRDVNQSLYSNLQNQSQMTMPNILHDMLKSSPLQTSNSENDNVYTTINCQSSSSSSSSSILNTNDDDDDEMISLKLTKQIKTMDRSNPLFRRMVLTLMRHQMNKNKLNNQREKILSTPPPSVISPSSSSNQHFQLNQNSTFDLDVETILDFERTTFGDSFFDIHDLPNL